MSKRIKARITIKNDKTGEILYKNKNGHVILLNPIEKFIRKIKRLFKIKDYSGYFKMKKF